MVHRLFRSGGLFKVLNQIGNLVVLLTLLLHSAEAGTGAATLHEVGVTSQIIHTLGAQLTEDSGDKLLNSSVLGVTRHNIGVGRNGGLDCIIV